MAMSYDQAVSFYTKNRNKFPGMTASQAVEQLVRGGEIPVAPAEAAPTAIPVSAPAAPVAAALAAAAPPPVPMAATAPEPEPVPPPAPAPVADTLAPIRPRLGHLIWRIQKRPLLRQQLRMLR
jgi:hypothetical protein